MVRMKTREAVSAFFGGGALVVGIALSPVFLPASSGSVAPRGTTTSSQSTPSTASTPSTECQDHEFCGERTTTTVPAPDPKTKDETDINNAISTLSNTTTTTARSVVTLPRTG